MEEKKQTVDLAVRYKLPENWNNEKEFSFDHLSQLVEQVHNSAYSSAVKAINRFYSSYPQIREFLEGKSATALHQSAISATVSHKSEIFPTTSGELISRLSFAHIRQLMTEEQMEYVVECINEFRG